MEAINTTAPDVTAFLQKANLDPIITELKEHFKNNPLIISDVYDDKGNQYVDLVQEGGGVLGVALVGYTYVLEKMGIRFFSLAGTSAGSINTMLLACSGNREDEKSEKITQHLLELDMFQIVDGKQRKKGFTNSVKNLVREFLLKKNFIKQITKVVLFIVGLFLALTVISFIANFFAPGTITKWIGFSALLILVIIIISILLIKGWLKKFSVNFGINEGTFFHQWINSKISCCNITNDSKLGCINNLEDFAKHYMRVPPNLQVRHDDRRQDTTPPNNPMMVIVACDIVSGRKIEFPRMWDLFWDDMKSVHPGDFVRASMSIPVFFETYTIQPVKSKLSIWQSSLNWKDKGLPAKAMLVDGGTLSNFPINVFYNPNYAVPRMPTFGIRLQDGKPDGPSSTKKFSNYLMSIFSTLRFHTDRDFMLRNRAYELGVQPVPLQGHSWLNFFMSEDEKVDIFRKGALAARDFLLRFNWDDYKNERQKSFDIMKQQQTDLNNFKNIR